MKKAILGRFGARKQPVGGRRPRHVDARLGDGPGKGKRKGRGGGLLTCWS